MTRSLAVCVLVGGFLLAWSAGAAWAARADLLAVRTTLQTMRGSEQFLGGPESRQAVTQARLLADRAANRLSSAGPRLVAGVPLLGRSLAAERDVANAALAVLESTERVLPLAASIDASDGSVPLDDVLRLADELAASATRTREPLRRLELAPLGGTPGVIRDAVETARQQLLPLGDVFARTAAGLRATHGLMGGAGPRTLVVGVMNNAELRGAGGYVSSFALVHTEGGRVEVTPFQDVNGVQARPAEAVRVPAPPDFSRRYGHYLADTTLWKNVAMSPHVPASAQVMCEVVRLRPGAPCDGVVLLDVPALASIIELTGGAKVGGRHVSGDELVRVLLVEAYAEPIEAGTAADKAQEQRRAELRKAADAALNKLLTTRLAAPSAARVLGRAAAGRHLGIWSARPQEQRSLDEAGMSGSAEPAGADLSLVSVNQLSASKLDYYVRRDVAVSAEVDTEKATVEQRVRFTLEHPDDLPDYVLGVHGGQLDALVDMGMASHATAVTLTRDGSPAAFELVRNDTGSSRAAFLLSLRNGEQAEFLLRYRVPIEDGQYRLALLPQPLAAPATLSVAVRAADGLRLEGAGGSYTGSFDATRRLAVRATEPGWWHRPLRRP